MCVGAGAVCCCALLLVPVVLSCLVFVVCDCVLFGVSCLLFVVL